MSAVWQARLAASASRGAAVVVEGLAWAGRPDVQPRLRRVIGALLVTWIAVSLWRGAWSFFPEAPPLPPTDVINPMQQTQSLAADGATRVDIDALAAVPLFGVPGETLSEEVLAASGGRAPTMSEAEAARELAGIEDGAPESRLPLVLQGVVAASEAGLGQAVIEHRNIQDLYQVGDELPVAGDVVLAKVLPDRVVLENGGRYEVLRLFEDGGLERIDLRDPVSAGRADAPLQAPSRPAPVATPPVPGEATAVAARYRDRLYENPESLVDVVRISAVRDGDALRGYRVMPGRNAAEFAALGFRTGDLVTAVNGMSLSDPSNTIRLYQTMRSATAASFELERDGEAITLEVSLEGQGGSGDS